MGMNFFYNDNVGCEENNITPIKFLENILNRELLATGASYRISYGCVEEQNANIAS